MKALYLTPVVTSFGKDGRIDPDDNKKIWDRLIGGGVDGIVVLGSTGEFFSMSTEQKKELIALAAEHIKKRVRLIVGTGCPTLNETIELSEFATEKGADGVMIVTPFYFHLSQESIESFYCEIASQTKAKIYLYNYPERTNHDVSAKLAFRLAMKHENIIGYKDSVVGMNHTREVIDLIKTQRPNFEVFCGLDENFAHHILSGGDGCVGGLSNIYPELCSSWAKALIDENMVETARIQKIVNKIVPVYRITEPYIPALKTAMKLNGIMDNDYCLPPLMPTTIDQQGLIQKLLKNVI